MTIKLLFNYKNLDQKLRQIKLLQTLFGLGLKEANTQLLINNLSKNGKSKFWSL